MICLQNEGGISALLRKINDQALESGETSKETIRKLIKALDKGREVGIQEACYRCLGLTMTRFSSIVKFINTSHPDRRDGLLKANVDELGNIETFIEPGSIYMNHKLLFR